EEVVDPCRVAGQGELVLGQVGRAAEAGLGRGVDPAAELDETFEGPLVGVVGQAPTVEEEQRDPAAGHPVEGRSATHRGALPDQMVFGWWHPFARHREHKRTLRERPLRSRPRYVRSCLRSTSLRPPQMPWGSLISRA